MEFSLSHSLDDFFHDGLFITRLHHSHSVANVALHWFLLWALLLAHSGNCATGCFTGPKFWSACCKVQSLKTPFRVCPPQRAKQGRDKFPLLVLLTWWIQIRSPLNFHPRVPIYFPFLGCEKTLYPSDGTIRHSWMAGVNGILSCLRAPGLTLMCHVLSYSVVLYCSSAALEL